ncbi:F-box DNA helicase 1 [Passer domesticus]|uniref:F-box DNA helicase 1 n=1 Tax=Passer domesticus TaxID=48849 RepID=UPI0030FE51A4
MRGCRSRRLTAPECAALAQSAQGSAPLRQPLCQGGGGGTARGLHPARGTPRHRGAPGRQRKISDFFGIAKAPQVGPAGMPSCGIKEEPLDPFFPGPPDSFSNPSLSQHSQDLVPPPMGHSRKTGIPKAEPLDPFFPGPPDSFSSPSLSQHSQDLVPPPRGHSSKRGIPKAEQDLWEEPEEKIPALSGVKQDWEELEVEPLPDSHYGLLGTRSWQVPQGSMSDLPPEILRNIFAFLPVLDLYQSLSLVCRCWREIIRDPQPEKMWAIFAVMVLFSDGVGDIQRLLERVRSPRSGLAVLEVTEVLHCMATLLLAMRDQGIPISNRIHYNIFYYLYLMENASGVVQPLEEGRMDLCPSGWADVKLTHEQQRILSHKIEPGQTVKIMAFAGTGKTSTLVKYAEKFSELKFLYLTFNKAVAEKGKKVFPRNVTCKTFHSLAFGSIGRHYKEKGKLNFSKLSVYSISFLLRNREGQSLFVRGKTVSQTLENFFSSSDEEICEEHTPLWFKNTHGQMQQVSREEKRINVEEAKEIWHNMKKLDGDAEKKYNMTCDGYLKLWQLSKPQLSGYDAIFVDEAQDCTPAIVDIVQSQRCGKILVGDPHQQIYTFRGAVNTLYLVPHTHVYYLTQSFRFGPEIAYVGATILDVCKGIRSRTLLGGDQRGDVRGGREGKVALLSRSNWNVFEDAVEFSGRNPPAKFHVIGGLERFGLSRIYDIWKLSLPADVRKNSQLRIEDAFVRRWAGAGGLPALREFAARADDRDLQGKICLVDRYSHSIPALLGRIRDSHVPHEALADVLIGTVHQAKGLEFDTVCVADDFVQIPSVTGDFLRTMNTALARTPQDEWNLLYVAVTRAKKCLLMSKSLENLLALAGERFLRVELLSEAGKDKDGAAVVCCVSGCAKPLEVSSGLVVKKLPLTHSDGSRDPGGFLCQACTWLFFGSLTPLTSFPTTQ